MFSPITSAFELSGYLIGALICVIVLGDVVFNHALLRVPDGAWWFLLVLGFQSWASADGSDNRIISFVMLCATFTALSIYRARFAQYQIVIGSFINVLAALAVIDALFISPFIETPSYTRSALLHPNLVAALLLLGLPFGNLALVALGLLATQCRGAWLGVMVSVLVLYASQRTRWAMLAGAAVSSIGMWFMRPDTILWRFGVWLKALGLFALRPVTGWGPGTYMVASANPDAPHAHNAALTIMAEQGMLGVLAVGPFVLGIVRRLRVCADYRVWVALISFGVLNMVDDIWLSVSWPAILLGAVLFLISDEYHKTSLA